MTEKRDSEIDRNFQFFQGYVGSLLPDEAGKFALLRHQNVVAVYESLIDAAVSGHSQFGDGIFSIQEVTEAPMDLGFFSHANLEGRVC